MARRVVTSKRPSTRGRRLAAFYGSTQAVCSNCKDFLYYFVLHFGAERSRASPKSPYQTAARLEGCMIAGMRVSHVCHGWAKRREVSATSVPAVPGPVNKGTGVPGCQVCVHWHAHPTITSTPEQVLAAYGVDIDALTASAATLRTQRDGDVSAEPKISKAGTVKVSASVKHIKRLASTKAVAARSVPFAAHVAEAVAAAPAEVEGSTTSSTIEESDSEQPTPMEHGNDIWNFDEETSEHLHSSGFSSPSWECELGYGSAGTDEFFPLEPEQPQHISWV